MSAAGGRPLLELDAVSAGYGPVQALSAVSIRVMPGEIVTLIGANGAGKSTLLMTICGDPKPRAGRDIASCPARTARRGPIWSIWPTSAAARAGA